VTNPETVSDVFHFADTLSLSKKKKTVAAMSAIEMIQKEIPTKSSCFSTESDAAIAELEKVAAMTLVAPTMVVTDLVFDMIMLVSLNMHDWLIRKTMKPFTCHGFSGLCPD
jgi:hypothetical protein